MRINLKFCVTAAAAFFGLTASAAAESRVPAPQPVSSDYYVACHYFPGWGVKQNGYSMFKDVLDFPERMPLIGCYDESDPEVADWQVKWAREHGINCFIFCWYRQKANVGKSVTTNDLLLAHQLPAFEKAAYGKMIDFAIMWECDNAGGAADARDLAENLVPFWAENYFSKPNYLKLGNRPVLFVYDNRFNLMNGLGGPAQLRAAFDAASARARDFGFDGIHFMAENRNRSREQFDRLRAAGYEQTFAYCWRTRAGELPQEEVMKVQLDGNRMRAAYDPKMAILTASQAWDPYPWHRRWYPKRPVSRWKLTPENWRTVLEEIRKMADAMPADAVGHRFVMLDNWNEWCEGHYIAPHRSGGFKYLQAVREVFTKRDNLPDYRLPHDLGLGPYDKGIDWNAPEVKWDQQEPAPDRSGRGMLLLSFDDSHYADWVSCLPLFEKYGAHVSFFPAGGLDESALRALKRLHDAGHTIGTHTVGHGDVPEAVAAQGEEAFWARQVEPHLRALEGVGVRVSSFAYPNGVRTEATDQLLLRRGLRHIRGCGDGAHEVTTYCGPGRPRPAWRPVAENPYAFNRREDLANCRLFSRATVGEAYQTDIADLCAAIRRAAREDKVLQFVSHGISPDARHIHMKTAWLEAILATAKEVGMRISGYDELPPPDDAAVATSPDGRNQIFLRTHPLAYEIRRDGVPLVASSRIGLTVDGRELAAETAAPAFVELTKTGREASPVYKKSHVGLEGRELFVGFGNWGVRLAARNDGVAYRFETMREGTARVDSELGELVVADRDADCVAHLSKRCGCEENPASFLKARDLVPPEKSPACLPLFLSAGGKTLVMTEADVCDYPVAYLVREKRDDGAVSFRSVFAAYPAETYHAGKGNWDPQVPSKERGRWEIVKSSEPYLVKTAGRRTFPWRAFLLADRPADLMASDLVRALARPAEAGRDFSWVKPGKVTWEWWNAWDNIGDPIKGGADGCTTETYRRFFDLAAEHGVEYVIFDEGWSQTLDIWNLNENVDLKSLIAYGRERGVGTILWMAWDQVVGDEERVAREFAKLGVKGFKVDFMNRGDAACERFYWDFARACAEHRLVVDFHGAHRPTGLSRAYPNVLNYEGVHGLEQMKFYRGQDILANDVAICFTRMSAGPLDYTPGAMDNYPVGRYPTSKVKNEMFTNPGSLGTRSRQLAMLVVYEAPLQMLCDSVKKYRANLECFRFMAGTPVVWDETVGLGGSPRSYAAVARKAKDGAWYAAAIGNDRPHDVTVDTGFLGEGSWTVESFRDADDSDMHPTHYAHASGKAVRAGERLTCRLAPGGGFVLKFVRR